ncbi:MAG: hypothetical protein E7397_04665 [Ruminococcaceae bacterium]|nr:hypothetical protein [Oscillospiraceae bacterium]
MKRILSLVISFALVLAALSAPVYAKKEQAEESWLAMQGLGIVDSQDNAATPFTVAELCEMVYRLMNPDVTQTPEGTRQIYTDVDRWYWAAGYIEWLYYNRIYTGDGSGSLEPERNATLSDVCNVMLNLLGYQQVKEYVKDEASPIHKAGELGLLPPSVSRAEHELTYGEFAAICYELLFTEVMEVSFDDALGFFRGDEFVRAVLQLDYAEGVITATNGFSLSYQECGADEIVIDGNHFTVASGTDYREYLGYSVQYFFDAKAKELVALFPTTNEVLTISSEQLLEYENNRYTYEEGEKEKKAKVSAEVMVLYNGKVTTNRDAFLPAYGQVTLIDNNKDGYYDCIISENVVNVILASTINGVMLGKNGDGTGRKYSLDLEEIEKYEIIGTDLPFAEWKANTVVSVMMSEDGDFVRLYVSTETKAGVLKLLAEDEVLIGEDEYLPAVGLFNPNSIQTAGNEVTLLLDIYGNVAAVLGTHESKYQLAYLMDVREDDVEEQLILKLLTAENGVRRFYTSEKLYIDGDKVESIEAAKDLLVVGQVIKYRMADEEIKHIDIAFVKEGFTPYQAASDKDSLRMIANGNMLYKSAPQLFKRYGAMVFQTEFAVTDDTCIFFIPMDQENATDEDYYVGTRTSLSEDMIADVQGYVTGAFTLAADAVAVSYRPELKHSSAITVVGKVVETIDEDDNIIHKISGMSGGKQIEVTVKDAGLLQTANGTVSAGSVIRYQTDKDGIVKTIHHLYNAEAREGALYSSTTHTYTAGSTGVNAHVRIMLGSILSHHGTVAQFRFMDQVSADEVFNLKNCNVYVYDSSEKESLRVGKIDEVKDFSYYGSLGDEVVVVTRAVKTSDVIIFKK